MKLEEVIPFDNKGISSGSGGWNGRGERAEGEVLGFGVWGLGEKGQGFRL